MGSEQLVIIGLGEFADIAFEYFSVDSDYEVVAFAAGVEFIADPTKRELPIVDIEHLPSSYPPDRHHVFVAVSAGRLNRERQMLMERIKSKGYTLATYVSSQSFVWRTADLGENVFIFEHNVVQHGVKIGDGVILWSGNHIGHQSQIGAYTFVSSHAVISGYCTVGRNCFIGVNACLADNLKIGDDCYVAMGAVVNRSFEDPGLMITGHPARAAKVSAYRYFRLDT